MPIRIRVTDNEKTKELRENLTGGDCDQQTLISYYRKEGNLVFVFDCEESLLSATATRITTNFTGAMSSK